MKVKQLIKLLQQHPNHEVLFTDGVNGEYGEVIREVNVRQVEGKRRVVVIQGYDYGGGEVYEFTDTEND